MARRMSGIKAKRPKSARQRDGLMAPRDPFRTFPGDQTWAPVASICRLNPNNRSCVRVTCVEGYGSFNQIRIPLLDAVRLQMRYTENSGLIWPRLTAIATWASRIESLRRRRALKASILAILASAVGPAVADDARAVHPPRAAPISSNPGGQTYGRWAVEWWQWALGVPAATNPLLDVTGENCDQHQVDDTWFLAGSFESDPVVRECTVPEGKGLFFPLINNGFFALLTDPPEQRTEEFVREQAACAFPVELFAEIDGFEIRRLDRFFTGESGSQSPLFNVQLPPGNIFGAGEIDIPELVLSPSAEEGYYLFVRPLVLGEHTVRWLAKGCLDPTFVQDITYNLTIVPAEDVVADRQDDAEVRVGGFRMPRDSGIED